MNKPSRIHVSRGPQILRSSALAGTPEKPSSFCKQRKFKKSTEESRERKTSDQIDSGNWIGKNEHEKGVWTERKSDLRENWVGNVGGKSEQGYVPLWREDVEFFSFFPLKKGKSRIYENRKRNSKRLWLSIYI